MRPAGKAPGFVEKQDIILRLRLILRDAEGRIVLQASGWKQTELIGFLSHVQRACRQEEDVSHIEARNTTRMLFAGNLIKHPCFDRLRKTSDEYRVIDV